MKKIDQLSHSSDAQRSKERIRKRILSAGIATVIGAGALTACGTANAEPDEPKPTVTHSAEPTVEPTVEPTPYEIETVIPIEEMTIPEHLVPYEQMEVSEFLALSPEERLPYVSWLNRDKEEIADIWYSVSGNPADRYPGRITLDSSNREILTDASYFYRGAFVTHFNRNGGGGAGIWLSDDDALKLISGAFFDTNSSAAQDWFTTLTEWRATDDSFPSPGMMHNAGGLQAGELVPGSEENVPMVIGDKEYMTRTITSILNANGKHLEITYAYVEFTDYKGDPDGAFVEISRRLY